LQAAKGRELELSVALEIVKQERSSFEKQANVLSEQLDRSNRRSDRLEQKLHDLTASFAHLVSQRDRLVAKTQSKSKTTLQWRNGKAVLLLEEPVNSHLINRMDY
jgi:chromosome segregation ATPase